MPPRPDSSQNGGAKKKRQESRLLERIDKLMEQLESQRQEGKEEMEKLLQRLTGKAAN